MHAWLRSRKRVENKNREQVAKILHNCNINSQNMTDYEKCILEIAHFFDKCKVVDTLEAQRMETRKDRKYDRRDEEGKTLWEEVSAEDSRRKNQAYKETMLSLKDQTEKAKGQKRDATAVTGDHETEYARTRK
jgi:hypothetical protein